MSEKKRSEVADVDRSLYDFTKSEEGYERYDDGLTPEIVRAISKKKEEPEWMLQMRLSALETYHQRQMATNWGPSIAGLDLNHISTYVSPKTQQANSWDDVPEDIRDTFDRLGIPQAEAESLAGVGAQQLPRACCDRQSQNRIEHQHQQGSLPLPVECPDDQRYP